MAPGRSSGMERGRVVHLVDVVSPCRPLPHHVHDTYRRHSGLREAHMVVMGAQVAHESQSGIGRQRLGRGHGTLVKCRSDDTIQRVVHDAG